MNPYQPVSGVTFLKTKDLEATTHFYTQIMGFKLGNL